MEGLRARQPWALDAMVEAHGARIRRVVLRILGSGDPDILDIVNETFARALENLGSLENPEAFGGWMAQIAVFVARESIRKRQRSRSLFFHADDVEGTSPHASEPDREASRCVYAIFALMPTDERILVALRRIEKMSHDELAELLQVSVPTIRRRLKKAESRFDRLAQRYEALAVWREQP